MDHNSISSRKCPKMATQFNDVASVKKKKKPQLLLSAVRGAGLQTVQLAGSPHQNGIQHKFSSFQRDVLRELSENRRL